MCPAGDSRCGRSSSGRASFRAYPSLFLLWDACRGTRTTMALPDATTGIVAVTSGPVIYEPLVVF